MKRIFTFFMVACSSAAMMAQTLSVGTTVSDVSDGNTIAYKITAVDDESMTATAELITSGTDLGSAEKTLTIPETFVYQGYTVTPNSMESDGWLDGAQYGRIVFNSSITSINYRALRYAYNLTSVDLKNVTSLGMAVFENSPLTAIDLTKVTSIGDMVGRFSAITSLHIPAATSVSSFGAFTNCPNLKTITVEEGNPYVTAVDNMLVNSDSTTLYAINWGSTDALVVPSGVTKIMHALWNGLDADVYIPAASMVKISGYSENCQTRVHVPCDLLANYQGNDKWNNVSLVGIFNGTVSIDYDTEKGNIVVLDTIDCETVLVKAEAKAGNHFVKWNDGSRALQSTISISTTPSALFLSNDKVWAETASANDEYGNVTAIAGIYDVNDPIDIEATPKTGYHFVAWNDGNTDAARKVVLTQDTILVATFDIDIPAVATITSADEDQGTVTGGGTYRKGEVIVISATAKEKYKFVTWSDGVTENPRSITLAGDTTISATFERIPYLGDIITDVYEGNTIAYRLTNVDDEHQTATAELITPGTDLGSAEKTLTIPETFVYQGYTVTPNSMESDSWLSNAQYGRIVFNSSITSINSRALRYAYNLTSVDLKNVTSLGMAVFENSPLTAIDLTKVISIGAMVGRFSAITSLHIPAATSVSSRAFTSCPKLKTITVEEGNPYVTAVDNMLVTSDGTTLYAINWGSTDSLVVPSGVTTIMNALWNGLDADVYIPAASMVEISGYSENCQTRVHVPCDLLATYQGNDKWGTISLVGELFYHVNLVAEHGTIAREAVDGECDQIKLTATADAGYKFSQWADGSTKNPRVFTITEDTEISATFVADVPSALDQVELGTIEVRDGRVYCASDFRIYDTLGRDVTRLNGHLNGVYVVKVGDKAAKIVVR